MNTRIFDACVNARHRFEAFADDYAVTRINDDHSFDVLVTDWVQEVGSFGSSSYQGRGCIRISSRHFGIVYEKELYFDTVQIDEDANDVDVLEAIKDTEMFCAELVIRHVEEWCDAVMLPREQTYALVLSAASQAFKCEELARCRMHLPD